MTDAERELLLTVAKALAIEGRLGRRLIDAVERESEQHTEALARRTLYFDTAANAALAKELDAVIRERLDEAIARGRMIAAAMD